MQPENQRLPTGESREHQVPQCADLTGTELECEHLSNKKTGPAENVLPEEAETSPSPLQHPQVMLNQYKQRTLTYSKTSHYNETVSSISLLFSKSACYMWICVTVL